MKNIFTFKNILNTISIILFDLVVYVILALLLMNYEDFYDESKSMSSGHKISYLGLDLWHLINLIVIGYVICKITIEIRRTKSAKVSK